jgi:invasion protein IalB
MCCHTMRCLCVFAFGILTAVPVTAEETGPPALTFSRWAKFCLSGTCFVGREGRLNPDCAPVAVAVVLIERKGEAKKKLSVTLPTGMRVDRGVRIIIDQGEPIERPYAGCFVNGCTADYDDGMELIDRLKQGRTLVLEAIDKTDSPIRLGVPLADFADAYDGEPQEPKVFEETATTKLQAELHQREVRCETEK